jgi:hypothetical protein
VGAIEEAICVKPTSGVVFGVVLKETVGRIPVFPVDEVPAAVGSATVTWERGVVVGRGVDEGPARAVIVC